MTQWLKIDTEEKKIRTTDIRVPYPGQEFGEGISYLDENSFIEMTWKDGNAHILNRDDLTVRQTMPLWPGVTEGWGITLDP